MKITNYEQQYEIDQEKYWAKQEEKPMTKQTEVKHSPEATFTPGPWKNLDVFVDNGPNEWHITNGKWGSPTIAIAGTVEDANLIASAPELLEAAKKAEKALQWYGDKAESFEKANNPVRLKTCLALRNAIRKAEGME